MKSDEIDVLFIQPEKIKIEHLNLEGNELPLGLLYMASFVEKEGFTSKVLDFNIDSYNLISILKKTRPKIIAITAITPEILKAHEIAEKIKEFDGKIITIVGGPHASALPSSTLKEFPSFDYIARGEGEPIITTILKALKANKCIKKTKGLAYRNGDEIKKNKAQKEIEYVDTIPFPARYKVPLKKYIPLPGNYEKLPSTAIITSRGCPFNCKFCNKAVFSRKIRFRSPDNIIREIKHCINNYGIFDFRFVDDSLTLNKIRIKKICEEIIRNKLDISWNCYSRVDNIKYELLKLMKKAGCYHIKYGIESGSKRILDSISKDITLKQAELAIKLTKKADIECKTMFMLGIPGETKRDMIKSLNFAKKLSSDITTFLIFTPFPGSKFYSVLKKQKKIKNVPWDSYSEHSDYIIKSSINNKEINKIFKKTYKEFYIRPHYLKQRIKRLLKNPKREIKFIYQGLKILKPVFK